MSTCDAAFSRGHRDKLGYLWTSMWRCYHGEHWGARKEVKKKYLYQGCSLISFSYFLTEKKKKRKWALQLTAVVIDALDVCWLSFTFVSLAIFPRVIWNIPTSTGSGCWRYVVYINACQCDFDFGVLFKALLAVTDLGQWCKGHSKLRLLIR